VQRYFLALLVGSYLLAAWWPAPGRWLRQITLGEVRVFGDPVPIILPMALLALLLFNAGLGIRLGQVRQLFRQPLPLVAGLAANSLIALGFVVAATRLMWFWHPPELEEVQDLLAGLALIASVPIAGSSTAWSQNADGDMPLSVGLVFFSTLLSPLTTPLALVCVRPLAVGDYADALGGLTTPSSSLTLAACLVVPSILGLAVRQRLGDARVAAAKPSIKLANACVLLLLNYSNAAVALPQVMTDPDWHFVRTVLFFVCGLCSLLFASGWLLGGLLGLNRGRRIALTYALGLNNNGTGLVLAAVALANHPLVMLPIILYNLVQHLVAGVVQQLLRHSPKASEGSVGLDTTPGVLGLADKP
jgi:BASS family bile acid:Na+ symporter